MYAEASQAAARISGEQQSRAAETLRTATAIEQGDTAGGLS